MTPEIEFNWRPWQVPRSAIFSLFRPTQTSLDNEKLKVSTLQYLTRVKIAIYL